MLQMHTVRINGEEFSARTGDVLLDMALINGVDIPHDCRSGQCGTCRVSVLDGFVFEEGQLGTGMVHACRSRIISDVSVAFESVPASATHSGQVTAVVPLASDVVEVQVEVSKPLHYLPGQYLQVQFGGFPERPYSPTPPLEQDVDDGLVRFHVRRFENGQVSSALGTRIDAGHPVKLTGPFGSSYLRAGMSNRLVLIAEGTGFAPIWSIAEAALRENANRKIVAVIGAHSLESLYMIPALCRLVDYPNVELIPVADLHQSDASIVRMGQPTDFIPDLFSADTVHVAGLPAMVEAVSRMAARHDATCHADAFVPAARENSWLARTLTWALGDSSSAAAPKQAPRQEDALAR